MPRNSSGVYTLPAGNPVASNTPILASWANALTSDLVTEITASLDRYGRGGMLAPFKNADGNTGAPGITFQNEASTGISRPNSGQLSFSGTGVERARIDANGLTIPFSGGKLIANRLDALDGSLVYAVGTGFGFQWKINGNDKVVLDSNGRLVVGAGVANQQLHVVGNQRLQGDAALLEFVNTANAVRSGYLQMQAAGASTLMVEVNQALKLGTNSVPRFSIAAGGNFQPELDLTYHIGGISARALAVYAGTFFASSTGEGFRVANDFGYYSFFNSANNVRNGYIQGSATDITVQAETAGASVILAAPTSVVGKIAGTTRFILTDVLADFGVGARTAPVAVAYSATPNFNLRLSNTFYLGTMTGNVTGPTISNPSDGQIFTIRCVQDGTGGRTFTPGNLGATNASVIAGGIGTGANKVSFLNLMYNAGAARFEGSWTVLP